MDDSSRWLDHRLGALQLANRVQAPSVLLNPFETRGRQRDNPQMTQPSDSLQKLLFDFRTPDALTHWSAIDDGVMGGVSHSRLLPGEDDRHACFEGEVSLANGGGFASVRCRPLPLGVAGATVCVIEVRGDGRHYKLNLRTDDTFDGVNYQVRFTPPAGEWRRIVLPLTAFAPSWRGRAVPDAPTLDPARIRQVGLMIADRQAGAFRLEIRSIELVCESHPTGIADTESAHGPGE